MKVLYADRMHEGVGFSYNGHKAYLNGERPMFMWSEDVPDDELEPTVPHHVETYTDKPRQGEKMRGVKRLPCGTEEGKR